MTAIERQLRQECKRLLEDNEVDVILGWERGSLPLRTSPVFVRTAADCDRLVWDVTCDNSLAVYLPRLKGSRVGIVARGCDGRWVAQHIIEHRIDRAAAKVIAVPCSGVISRQAVDRAAGFRPVMHGAVEGDQAYLRGREWELTVPVSELIDTACKDCAHRSAPFSDVDLGSGQEGKLGFGDVEKFDSLSPDEKWAAFAAEVSKCIRCYACRQACPGCYCAVCFVDRTDPKWVGGTDDVSDAMAFHLMRAMHLAGRCVDCGACERACPAGVNMRLWSRRLERDAWELFGHVAGAGDKAALGTYRPDDPQEFIM